MFGELIRQIRQFIFLEYAISEEPVNKFMSLDDKKILLRNINKSMGIECIHQIVFCRFLGSYFRRLRFRTGGREIVDAVHGKIPSDTIQ